MRTQDEILKMIRQLQESGTDPAKVQQKTLFHKLEWQHAVKWIEPTARTRTQREKFESMNKTDQLSLKTELIERFDQLFLMISDGALVRVYLQLQMILVYLWLLREDELFEWLHPRLGWANMNWRKVARHLAEELGINWRILELRYP